MDIATKNILAQEIRSAESWTDLHNRLNLHGFIYQKFNRNGARICAMSGAEQIKASEVSNKASLFYLEKRLGPFVKGRVSVEFLDKPVPSDVIQLRKVVKHDLLNSDSWEELHARLARKGFTIFKKGSGVVLKNGVQEIKGSAIDRHASLFYLEKRLGSWQDFKNVPTDPESRAEVNEVMP